MSAKLSFAEQKAKQKARRRAVRMALFGTLIADPTRDELLVKFMRLMDDFGANEPEGFLHFLLEARRGFLFEHDGPSPAMGWVDRYKRATENQ